MLIISVGNYICQAHYTVRPHLHRELRRYVHIASRNAERHKQDGESHETATQGITITDGAMSRRLADLKEKAVDPRRYTRARLDADLTKPQKDASRVKTDRTKHVSSTIAPFINHDNDSPVVRDRQSCSSRSERTEGMSMAERDTFRKQLKERFKPASRELPATLRGLASLANQRIEDAIARGQFKNLPRGAPLERDYVASSPFLDTTEYFMNKIILKQEIVPPWIEKQQELMSTAVKFRGRLRADWRRHVARAIASRGGALEDHIQTAQAYADAEAALSDSLNVNADRSRFRDTAWERNERSYQELAIKQLNDITRSYNLMAPNAARKPYFSLERELQACFEDVAPHVAETIKSRAWIPVPKIETAGSEQIGIMARFSTSKGQVRDELRGKQYGFREFWRDIWGR